MPGWIRTRLFRVRMELRRRHTARRLARQTVVVPEDGIHVHYGEAHKTTSAGILHGGRVKLLHLQKRYPEQLERFNVLYLVSSGMPAYAQELVRWARGQGVRLVWNQNGVAYPAWAGKNSAATNEQMAGLRAQADYILYQSEFCRTSAERYLGPAPAPWEVVYNCVDTRVFSPRGQALPARPWVLLAAGSHQQPERVRSVLQTVAILRDRDRQVRLILAGRLDWPGAPGDVQRWLDEYRIRDDVVLDGPYAQADAPGLYRRAHVLLHTKYKDPCPTVVIEAMSCGVPVVGSNSGGLPELLGAQGGRLLAVADSWEQMHVPPAGTIADAVTGLMQDIDKWRQRARAHAVAQFGVEGWMAQHRKVFSDVLSAGPVPSLENGQ